MVLQLIPLAIDFLRPGRLWWLITIPVILAIYLVLSSRLPTRSRRKASSLDRVLPKDKPWKRHTAVLLSLLSLAALVVAFAQPATKIKTPRERATVILAIDVSRSMMAKDMSPSENRMEAAKEAAKEFVRDIPDGFNIGVVAFAGDAEPVIPPTTDKGAVERAIDNLELAPSTAIGEAIYTSLNQLKYVPEDPEHPDEPAPAVIVLLSDGETNTGRGSRQAAKEARNQGVPIYTIAFGTDHGYVEEGGIRQPVPVNHKELHDIAAESGGEKYSADSTRALKKVYEQISQSVGYEDTYGEITERFAGVALLFAVLAALGVISLGARWP